MNILFRLIELNRTTIAHTVYVSVYTHKNYSNSIAYAIDVDEIVMTDSFTIKNL